MLTFTNHRPNPIPCGSKYGRPGVVLPHSNQLLFEHEIDTKIEKAKNEILHLTNGQAHRLTHGGKRFRAREISRQNRIESCQERLMLLISAKAMIVEQNLYSQYVINRTMQIIGGFGLEEFDFPPREKIIERLLSSNKFIPNRTKNFPLLASSVTFEVNSDTRSLSSKTSNFESTLNDYFLKMRTEIIQRAIPVLPKPVTCGIKSTPTKSTNPVVTDQLDGDKDLYGDDDLYAVS